MRADPPRKNGELIFDEPWQSRAFGMAVALNEDQCYPWDDFRDRLIAQIADADARDDPAGYYERCKRANSPAMRDPNAVVYLVPGVGMITFAKDKATARISGEFYINAINVMRGASGVSSYVGLPEQEAFDIEYWLLEEAKLQRMPKPKPLAFSPRSLPTWLVVMSRTACGDRMRTLPRAPPLRSASRNVA